MKIKSYFISMWNTLDPIYFFFSRLHYLRQTGEDATVFRVRQMRYKGRMVILSDGTIIKKNDVLIKIHLHNVRLLKELQVIDNDLRRTKILYRKVKESLPQLALYVQKSGQEIKGVVGITMLNKGCKRLGFEPFSISSRPYKWFKQLTHYPIYLLSTSKWPSKDRKIPSPKYLFMSKKYLMKNYGL